MTPDKSAEERRAKALQLIGNRPDGWRYGVGAVVYDKKELIAEIEKKGVVGESAVELLSGCAVALGDKNQLGKRYRCVICGTEVLATKAGDGRAECCAQLMEMQEPRPVPSSD